MAAGRVFHQAFKELKPQRGQHGLCFAGAWANVAGDKLAEQLSCANWAAEVAIGNLQIKKAGGLELSGGFAPVGPVQTRAPWYQGHLGPAMQLSVPLPCRPSSGAADVGALHFTIQFKRQLMLAETITGVMMILGAALGLAWALGLCRGRFSLRVWLWRWRPIWRP